MPSGGGNWTFTCAFVTRAWASLDLALGTPLDRSVIAPIKDLTYDQRLPKKSISRAIMKRSGGGNDGGSTSTLLKGVLLGLGGLTLFAITLAMLKYVIFFGVLGGAGYLGYRLLTKDKALQSAEPKPRGKLSSGGDDFEQKMRELEAIERRLDREISGR